MNRKIGKLGGWLCGIICLAASIKVSAQPPASQLTLEKMNQGKHRFLLVFSPDNKNEMLLQQDRMLRQARLGLEDREMVVVQVVESSVQTLPDLAEPLPDATALRQEYKINPAQFTLVLVGKDGGEKYRASHAQAPAVLFQIIDDMPMRQSEVQEKRNE